MGIGRLLLRIVVGGIFVAHGMQKLTGAFGGGGLPGTQKMMEKQRMYPPERNALAVALAETVGGAAIVAGAGMPAATAATTAAMATAVRKVHLKNGFFNSQGGYEFNLALVASATALTIDGPGLLSVDALVGKPRWGVFWGALAVAAGWVMSSFVIEFSEDAARRAGADADPASTDTPKDAATGAAPASR
jgi:putative oxidoreductase